MVSFIIKEDSTEVPQSADMFCRSIPHCFQLHFWPNYEPLHSPYVAHELNNIISFYCPVKVSFYLLKCHFTFTIYLTRFYITFSTFTMAPMLLLYSLATLIVMSKSHFTFTIYLALFSITFSTFTMALMFLY